MIITHKYAHSEDVKSPELLVNVQTLQHLPTITRTTGAKKKAKSKKKSENKILYNLMQYYVKSCLENVLRMTKLLPH